MSSFIRTVAGSMAGTALLLAVVLGAAAWKLNAKPEIRDHSWLHLDLYGDLPEYDPPSGLAGALGGGGQTLQELLTSLDIAAVDDRIDGVVLQLSAANGAGAAKLQELRAAVGRVRAAGKPVYAYADNIDLRVVFTAAACDSFFCPPSAYIQILGLDRAVPHVRTALDKLGVNPQLSAIRAYKSAAQIVTRTELTPEARENAAWMLEERLDMYRAAIAEGRRVAPTALESWMEGALFVPEAALAAGIVDRLLYWGEFTDRFRRDDDPAPRLVASARYAQEDPDDLDLGGKQRIAVIHAQGNIGGRENTINPLLGLMMGHESINRELERARRDEDVVAIVLRVDSGGGESLASDLMGHKVEMVAREKPVVVSMVDVAASGGYSMSYRASRLVANPLTVTGSIGSISGKFDLSGFHAKIGLGHTHVSLGPNARLLDEGRPFSAEEFALFEADHEAGFRRWLEDVARARGLTVAEVEGLAMGRVFTGRQAAANGLVDETGGLHEAIAAARRLAGVDESQRTGVWHLPEKKGLLASLLGGEAEMTAAARALLRQAVREDVRQVQRSVVSTDWQVVHPVFTD